MLQFVQFARSYNITPSVLISANHSTTASGNLAPVHNGITTWIEVKHNAFIRFCKVLPGGETQCYIIIVHISYQVRQNYLSVLFPSRPFPVNKM